MFRSGFPTAGNRRGPVAPGPLLSHLQSPHRWKTGKHEGNKEHSRTPKPHGSTNGFTQARAHREVPEGPECCWTLPTQESTQQEPKRMELDGTPPDVGANGDNAERVRGIGSKRNRMRPPSPRVERGKRWLRWWLMRPVRAAQRRSLKCSKPR